MTAPDGADGPDDPHALAAEDGPVFDAPWQARAFAVAVALSEGAYDWTDFQERLVEEIDATAEPGGDPEAVYYRQWLAALERLLVEEGTVAEEELAARAAEFDAGDRDAHEFVEGDPHGHAAELGRDRNHDHEHEHEHVDGHHDDRADGHHEHDHADGHSHDRDPDRGPGRSH